MFAALKSLMSNHLSPGSAYVNLSPFSFAWFTRIQVDTMADSVGKEELVRKLTEVSVMLDLDNLAGGRERLESIIAELTSD
jgi:hypothetical protein